MAFKTKEGATQTSAVKPLKRMYPRPSYRVVQDDSRVGWRFVGITPGRINLLSPSSRGPTGPMEPAFLTAFSSSKRDRPNDAVVPCRASPLAFAHAPGAATHMAKLDRKQEDLFLREADRRKTGRRGRRKIEQYHIVQKPRSLKAAARSGKIIESNQIARVARLKQSRCGTARKFPQGVASDLLVHPVNASMSGHRVD